MIIQIEEIEINVICLIDDANATIGCLNLCSYNDFKLLNNLKLIFYAVLEYASTQTRLLNEAERLNNEFWKLVPAW